jgi:hypothetical protein
MPGVRVLRRSFEAIAVERSVSAAARHFEETLIFRKVDRPPMRVGRAWASF